MTILSDKLMDASKGGAADSVRFTPTGVRGANGGGGIVGPTPVSPTVNPTTGAFTTVDIDPGPYTVRIKWRGKAETETYKIVLPNSSTNLELFPLIQAYVAVPESTPAERIAEAVASYVEANPDFGGGANPHSHQQATAAATWTVDHNLGRYPAGVSVIVGTELVDTDVTHPTVDRTVVTFPSPTSGRVELI